MRFSATLTAAFAATAMACSFEQNPAMVDRFVKLRSAPLEGEPMYTLEFSDGTTRQVTEDEKWALKRAHIRFFDITDQGEELAVYSPPQVSSFAETDAEMSIQAFPSTLTQGAAVRSLIAKYSTANVRTTLTKFSSFFNRYYKSTTGVQSAQWLFDQVTATIAASGASSSTVSVRKFTNTFAQFSVIATIKGTSAKTVVVGAHQDSINQSNPANGEAAGADDDGSGSMAILEAFRVMLTDAKIVAGQAPNTLEFHWYAAEEAGLLGSQAIFQQYARDGKNVAAMLQQDMVGYSPKGVFGVITDNVSSTLTAFTRLVIGAYTSIKYVDTKCGYGCSDHASATRSGYPSAFVFEAAFDDSNPNIHTVRDTIDKVNFTHVLEHGKLILGFMYELAFSPNI